MNMSIYKLLGVFFAICVLEETSVAQTTILGDDLSGITNNLFNYKNFSKPKPMNELGTYYYDSAWQNGSIYMLDSSVASGLTLRYDLLSQEVEVMQKEKYNTVSVIRNHLITGFSLGENGITAPVIFTKSKWKTEDGKKEKGFIKVIKSQGEFTLYKAMKAVLQKSTYVPALQVGRQQDQWLIEDDLVIGFNGGEQHILPSKKSKAIELFKEYGKVDIEPYLKEHKLNTKKEEDVLRLIELLESN